MRDFSRSSSSAWNDARRDSFSTIFSSDGWIVDQQVAGRGAHEDLDAGRAFEPFQFGNVVDVLAGAADVEGEVAEHAVAGSADLGGQRRGGRRQRLVLGISNTAVTPPSDGCAAAGFEIFLVREARLAEMDLRVDDAGQDVQALCVQRIQQFWPTPARP